MEAGAGCLCLGLDYQPSANAPFEELVALCKVALAYDGIYAAHLRYQILGRDRAWQEIIDLHAPAAFRYTYPTNAWTARPARSWNRRSRTAWTSPSNPISTRPA